MNTSTCPERPLIPASSTTVTMASMLVISNPHSAIHASGIAKYWSPAVILVNNTSMLGILVLPSLISTFMSLGSPWTPKTSEPIPVMSPGLSAGKSMMVPKNPLEVKV